MRPIHRTIPALTLLASALLAACDGTTGGYPPAPGPYEASPGAVAAAKQPKFKPLIKALLDQRKAAAALGEREGGQIPKDYGQRFAKANAASDAVTKVVAEAQLSAEETAQWQQISSMTDEQLGAALGG